MTASGQLFVTGMLRSGTTLLQTLLTNHPQLFVAYQPFSQLYVDVKKLFLDKEGIARTLPLGDGTNGPLDEPERFQHWLRNERFDRKTLDQLVRRSVIGKGGSCAALADRLPVHGKYFAEIQTALHDALARLFGKVDSVWHGSKEILCEEYLPYLLEQNRQCFLIVRDPRAVMASANYGRYREMVGDCYPLLMLARIWRKSVAYALAYGSSSSLMVIRYEDLVRSTEAMLDSIAKFLRVEPFAENMLRGRDLLDHAGQPWVGNSSFGDKGATVDAESTSIWSTHLPGSQTDLIEALCYPEMLAMGYKPCLKISECENVIQSTLEDTRGVRASYLNDYALDKGERGRELARWTEICVRNSPHGAHGLWVLRGIRDKLLLALRSAVDAHG